MIIDHTAIRADDIKKVASWYQESINAEITHVDSFYIRLSTISFSNNIPIYF